MILNILLSKTETAAAHIKQDMNMVHKITNSSQEIEMTVNIRTSSLMKASRDRNILSSCSTNQALHFC